MASVPVLTAAKGGIALDQMALAANGAWDFLDALEARNARLLRLAFPTRC